MASGAVRRSGLGVEHSASTGSVRRTRSSILRCLSLDSVDRSDGGGLLRRRPVRAGACGPAAVDGQAGVGADGAIRRAARYQYLWRSCTVVDDCAGNNSTVLPELHKVSTVARLLADDAGAGDGDARVDGWTGLEQDQSSD